MVGQWSSSWINYSIYKAVEIREDAIRAGCNYEDKLESGEESFREDQTIKQLLM